MPIKYNHPEARKTSKEMLEIYHECWRCGSTQDVGVHHDDKDRLNNTDDNTYVLCAVCHGRIHGKDPVFGREYREHNYSLLTDDQLKEMAVKPPKERLLFQSVPMPQTPKKKNKKVKPDLTDQLKLL